MTPVIINACTGRMGRELIHAAIESDQVEIVAAIAREGHPSVGYDCGRLVGQIDSGVKVSTNLPEKLPADSVIVDFSLPSYSLATLNLAVERGLAMVIGTTGFSESQQQQIKEAATSVSVLYAANLSLGVNRLLKLLGQAATLFPEADVEIHETHHRHKVDAPSGTALAMGDVIAQQRGQSLGDVATWQRHGRTGARRDDEIGFAVSRMGGVVGEHTVSFALDGEVVSINHRALNRGCFATGALTAADWLSGRKPGLYRFESIIDG